MCVCVWGGGRGEFTPSAANSTGFQSPGQPTRGAIDPQRMHACKHASTQAYTHLYSAVDSSSLCFRSASTDVRTSPRATKAAGRPSTPELSSSDDDEPRQMDSGCPLLFLAAMAPSAEPNVSLFFPEAAPLLPLLRWPSPGPALLSMEETTPSSSDCPSAVSSRTNL